VKQANDFETEFDAEEMESKRAHFPEGLAGPEDGFDGETVSVAALRSDYSHWAGIGLGASSLREPDAPARRSKLERRKQRMN